MSVMPMRILLAALLATAPPVARQALRLDSTTALTLRNTRASWVEYRGRRALHLAPLAGHEHDTDQEMIAELTASDFRNGVIEIDVAGARRAGYATDNASAFKGFVGVSFRVRGDSAERFYLRTENARLDDQLFRNRSTQYESDPDYSWQRLRQESPGMYESYVDLEPGAWTRMRIEVSGTHARLYVNGAPQPCLVVNDLKLGEGHGRIALWTRISADAYFADLRVEDSRGHRGPGPRLQPREDGVGHLVRGERPAEVRGARAVRQRVPHGALHGARLALPAQRVAQQERRAEDRPYRVRHAAAGEVRGRAVDRLVETEAAAAIRGA
jgi:hypothetical protein